MALALVIYPTLRRHRMVPELTNRTLIRVVNDAVHPEIHSYSPAVGRVPVELWLHIVKDLQPMNSTSLVFALGHNFWRFPGEPSDELLRWLRTWASRSKEEKAGTKK
ncbi:hypothetical protein DE146DRAFT_641113 [Phaeosphaeria sp. MPI-PUGE-AT-0046c]|nr:hypothetical protein DE146DRAFT_641113 [Phaeosphaeria sp. MPI-PUGE-AT-0046c]